MSKWRLVVSNKISRLSKRWLLIILCLMLVVARIIWPHIQVDAISIWLLIVATVLFILPELRSLYPFIKRVRIGEVEFELKEEVKELGKEVEQVKEEVAKELGVKIPKEATSEILEILQASGKDPRSALLLISTQIDREVRLQLQSSHVPFEDYDTLPVLVKIGVERNLFPKMILDPVERFWDVRNSIVHNPFSDINDQTIYALIAIGAEITRLISLPSIHSI